MKFFFQILLFNIAFIQLSGQCSEDIILASQADVNAFATDYGCSVIEGDLKIITVSYLPSDIVDLSPLSSITEITGDLIIRSNSILTTLVGLENINDIGGNLQIKNNDLLVDLQGLEGLVDIGDCLFIEFNDGLLSTEGIENLSSIAFHLVIKYNGDLQDLGGLGGLVLVGGNVEILNNNSLSSLEGFEELETVLGTLEIIHNYSLGNINTFNSLEQLGGDLIIGNNSFLSSLLGFDQLNIIQGNLKIHNNTAIVDFVGLENIYTVLGNVNIYGLSNLTTLNGLENISKIGGSFKLFSNPSFETTNGISNIDSIGANLEIYNNLNLSSLADLENIDYVGGDLSVYENSLLDSCCQILELKPVTNGNVILYDNDNNCSSIISVFDNCTEGYSMLQGLLSESVCSANYTLDLGYSYEYELIIPDSLNIDLVEGLKYEVIYLTESLEGNSCSNIDATITVVSIVEIPFYCSLDLMVTSVEGYVSDIPTVDIDYSFEADYSYLYTYEFTINGIPHTPSFMTSEYNYYPDIPACDFFSSPVTFVLTAIDYLGIVACSDTVIMTPNSQPQGFHPDCPLVLNICAGESVQISADMVGAFGIVPDLNCPTCNYSISPMSSVSCFNNLCLDASASPIETTLYTMNYNESMLGNNGAGYILIEVENCGVSFLEGIVLDSPCTDNGFVLEDELGEVYELVIDDSLGVDLEVGFVFQVSYLNENIIGTNCSGVDSVIVLSSATLIPYSCSFYLDVTPLSENNTPVVELDFTLNADFSNYLTLELTINGEVHPLNEIDDSLIIYPDIPPCTYFNEPTTYTVSVFDYWGTVVCSDMKIVNPPNLSVPGVHPDCPVVFNICQGETVEIGVEMVAPSVANPCNNCFYSISPMTDVDCEDDCFVASVSPLETTMYTYSFSQYSNVGVGYVLVEVADCGSSQDAGVVNFIQDANYLYEGEKDIIVDIQNFGVGLLDNVIVDWSVNGVLQDAYYYNNGTLTTGEQEQLIIGSYSFDYETNYEIEIWTSMPNGNMDNFTTNDTVSVELNISDLNADSNLLNAAELVYVVCEGDTVNSSFPLSYFECGLDPSIFEYINWSPIAGIDIGDVNHNNFDVYPSTNTFFELYASYVHPECNISTILTLTVYVLVDNNCQNNIEASTADSGQIFFEDCGNGDIYFFLETSEGEILDPYFPDSIDFTYYDGMLVDYEYVAADFDSPCSAATAVYITEIVEVPRSLDLTIWLEGVDETVPGIMETDLTNLQLLPSEQPFNQAPWFYDGTETLPLETDDIVDWVLVEFRTGTPSLINPGTTVVYQEAALLLSDGSIVGVENNEPINLYGIAEGESYYVSIRHRNHLDVLSASPITFDSTNSAAYDFTSNINQAFGPSQLKVLSNGKAALYAGDYNGDGVIQSTDYDVWQSEPAAVNVYEATDGNLDGVIQATDYDVWFPNKAKVGAGEIQY